MKISIRPQDCKFIVNKEQRKVVCIMENTSNIMLNFIGWPYNVPFGMPKKSIEKFYMPKRFVGIATCSEEDEWDEDFGKMLAFSRMKHKVCTSFFKRGNLLVNSIDNELNDLIDKFNAYGEKLEKNTERLEKKISCKNDAE